MLAIDLIKPSTIVINSTGNGAKSAVSTEAASETEVALETETTSVTEAASVTTPTTTKDCPARTTTVPSPTSRAATIGTPPHPALLPPHTAQPGWARWAGLIVAISHRMRISTAWSLRGSLTEGRGTAGAGDVEMRMVALMRHLGEQWRWLLGHFGLTLRSRPPPGQGYGRGNEYGRYDAPSG